MNKIYLVSYCGDNCKDTIIFVTTKKSTATKYATKFNNMLKRWKEWYKQYEEDYYGFRWVKDEFVEQHFHRWDMLQNISKCYND